VRLVEADRAGIQFLVEVEEHADDACMLDCTSTSKPGPEAVGRFYQLGLRAARADRTGFLVGEARIIDARRTPHAAAGRWRKTSLLIL
jgi:hypothetical protein